MQRCQLSTCFRACLRTLGGYGAARLPGDWIGAAYGVRGKGDARGRRLTGPGITNVTSSPVSRVLSRVIIYLGLMLPRASSGPTRGRSGQLHVPPIWPCSGWGLPSRPVARTLVRSYRTVSPLPCTERAAHGGLISVALSLKSPSLGVTQHPALRSSDFPQADIRPPAITQTACHSSPFMLTLCRPWRQLRTAPRRSLYVSGSIPTSARLADTSVPRLLAHSMQRLVSGSASTLSLGISLPQISHLRLTL